MLMLCSKETEMPTLMQRLIHYLSAFAFQLAEVPALAKPQEAFPPPPIWKEPGQEESQGCAEVSGGMCRSGDLRSSMQVCVCRRDMGKRRICAWWGECVPPGACRKGFARAGMCVCISVTRRGTRELAQQGTTAWVGGNQHVRLLAGTCMQEARCCAWRCSLCTVRLTREARRDILLRGLGNSGLSICSFSKNSGGRRMSMGRERRLLTSCGEGPKSGW